MQHRNGGVGGADIGGPVKQIVDRRYVGLAVDGEWNPVENVVRKLDIRRVCHFARMMAIDTFIAA